MLLRVFFAFLLLFFLTSCGEKGEKPLVVTSVFPLTWVAKEVYPSYGVYQVIKPPANPHLYDLTPKDAIKLSQAKKVFLIGNLESFASKVPEDKRVEVIKLLGLPPSVNPHLWLSPKRWLGFALSLPKVEGINLDHQRWQEVTEKLRDLDREYSKLKGLNLKVVMIHPAFVWLCKDYGIEVIATLETKEGLGISPKTLVDAVETLKGLKERGKVLVLYVSTNPKEEEIAKELSQKAGVKSVGLDPLVGYTKGDYIKLMEGNLKKILNVVR
ncbi:MAG TPA: zinc ABC transporter substrate-binding protein [Aquifex aeolicus]|nr:zinc ABC transporter substrate-binding protein [Aquifex aeolicus]